MKHLKSMVVRVACAPADLVGLLGWVFVRVFWGQPVLDAPQGVEMEADVLAVELKHESWPARTWYRRWGGTTVGHFIMFGAGRAGGARIWRHELVHVMQCEAVSVGALILALGLAAAGQQLGAFIVYACPYFVMAVGGWTAAWLRGLRPYRDSQHERSAYAQQWMAPASNEEITPVGGQRPGAIPPATTGVLPRVPESLPTRRNRQGG